MRTMLLATVPRALHPYLDEYIAGPDERHALENLLGDAMDLTRDSINPFYQYQSLLPPIPPQRGTRSATQLLNKAAATEADKLYHFRRTRYSYRMRSWSATVFTLPLALALPIQLPSLSPSFSLDPTTYSCNASTSHLSSCSDSRYTHALRCPLRLPTHSALYAHAILLAPLWNTHSTGTRGNHFCGICAPPSSNTLLVYGRHDIHRILVKLFFYVIVTRYFEIKVMKCI
jgi:hypothetical protein